jgi:hypothetical protein
VDTTQQISALVRIADRTEHLKPATAAEHVRRWARAEGVPLLPFGGENPKTGSFGFYRPVGGSERGGSCPDSCRFLGRGCYADGGSPVANAAKRSTLDVDAAVTSALACAVLSQRRYGCPGRGLVSGDLCRDGRVDGLLVLRLAESMREAREALGCSYALQLFTHAQGVEADAATQALRASGCAVVRSEQAVAGGAVVAPFSRVPELRERHPGVRLVCCPAQTRHDRTCRQCQLCARAADIGVCVVFRPHGAQAKRLPISLD